MIAQKDPDSAALHPGYKTEPRILVRDERPSKQRALALVEQKTQIRDSLDILRESLGRKQ